MLSSICAILTIALALCYKTPVFLIFDISVLLQRERTKYANGLDSKINVHTKFEVSVFMRCRLIQRVQNLKVGHATQAALATISRSQ